MADQKDFEDINLQDTEYPANLCCPISLTLMKDPVILIEDYVTYEKSMLQDWFKLHNTSPMTNKVLKSKKFIPNLAIKTQIDEYNQQKFMVSFESVSNNFNNKNPIRLLLVGDSAVGKTSLRKYLEFGNNDNYVLPTIGPESSYFKFNYNNKNNGSGTNDCIVRVEDLPGQFDRFRSVTKQCYRGIHGVVLVCSLDRSDSVNSLKNNWLKEIHENASDNIYGIVIINKCDLLTSSSKHQQLMKTATEFANNIGYSVYCCSCLTGEYVHSAFKELVVRIMGDNDIWNDSQVDGGINVNQRLSGVNDYRQYDGCMFALKSFENSFCIY